MQGTQATMVSPTRERALLGSVETTEDQHRVWIAYGLDQIGTQIITDGVCISACPPQQMLETKGVASPLTSANCQPFLRSTGLSKPRM